MRNHISVPVFVLLLWFLMPFSQAAASDCININVAPKEELEKIIHIGEARAEQIIALRREIPFASIEDLERVTGIGSSRIADIKNQGLACVENSQSEPKESLNPQLKSEPEPKIQKPIEESSEISGTEEIDSSEENQTLPSRRQDEKTLKSLHVFLTAFPLAVFSGIIILLLKKKLGDNAVLPNDLDLSL